MDAADVAALLDRVVSEVPKDVFHKRANGLDRPGRPPESMPASGRETAIRTLENVKSWFKGTRGEAAPDPTLQTATRQNSLPEGSDAQWHTLSGSEVCSFWETSRQKGLSLSVAGKRLAEYGPNSLPQAKPRSTLSIFFNQFRSVPVLLLIGTSVLSAATGGLADALVILGVVCLNAYACNYTPSLMPLPIWLARKLTRRIDQVRHEGLLPYLAPESKCEVGVEFVDRRPCRIYSVNVIAAQKQIAEPTLRKLRDDLRQYVIDAAFRDEEVKPDDRTKIQLNLAGPVLKGGPSVHAGLTGRKTAEDTYGEFARHSQTALSGKDPSRIGRTGAYIARYAAANIVAAQLADECEVQLSYSLGSAGPISIQVETFGTGRVPDEEIVDRLQ